MFVSLFIAIEIGIPANFYLPFHDSYSSSLAAVVLESNSDLTLFIIELLHQRA